MSTNQGTFRAIGLGAKHPGMDHPTPRLLTATDVAKELQVTRSTAYRLIAEGEVPSVRIGGSVRVPSEALDSLIASRTRGTQK
jgi:excisionase family DNA binding protein